MVGGLWSGEGRGRTRALGRCRVEVLGGCRGWQCSVLGSSEEGGGREGGEGEGNDSEPDAAESSLVPASSATVGRHCGCLSPLSRGGKVREGAHSPQLGRARDWRRRGPGARNRLERGCVRLCRRRAQLERKCASCSASVSAACGGRSCCRPAAEPGDRRRRCGPPHTPSTAPRSRSLPRSATAAELQLSLQPARPLS